MLLSGGGAVSSTCCQRVLARVGVVNETDGVFQEGSAANASANMHWVVNETDGFSHDKGHSAKKKKKKKTKKTARTQQARRHGHRSYTMYMQVARGVVNETDGFTRRTQYTHPHEMYCGWVFMDGAAGGVVSELPGATDRG